MRDPSIFEQPVSTLKVRARIFNILHRANCNTIGDVCRLTEFDLKRVKDCGAIALLQIKEALGKLNLSLGMQVPDPPAPDLLDLSVTADDCEMWANICKQVGKPIKLRLLIELSQAQRS